MLLFPRLLALAFAITAITSMVSCSSVPEVPEDRTLDNRAWWTGGGVEGERKIVIDLSAQRLRYFKGGKLVGVSPISSGKEGTSTLNGNFSIKEKDIDHRSATYGAFVDENGSVVESDVNAHKDKAPPGTKFLGASMRYCMRIVGGFCMHEGYLPGYPASHGCVRLPTRMAQIFFEDTPLGTPVQIIGHGSHAVAEEHVPIGHGEVAAAEPSDDDDEAGDDDDEPRKKRKQTEIVRRAEVAHVDSTPRSNRFETARSLRKKYGKRSGTMYLD